MPVIKCSNKKYRIGKGSCIYKTKDSAERAYKGYLGAKYGHYLKEDENILGVYYVDNIPISIEYVKGDVQTGTNKLTNKEWTRKFYVHYGFINGMKSVDGDSLDVFAKPVDNKNKKVYVIHQLSIEGDEYDEPKIFLGFKDSDEALKCWMLHNPFYKVSFGGIDEFEMEEFKNILEKIKMGAEGLIIKKYTLSVLNKKLILPLNTPSVAFNEYINDEELKEPERNDINQPSNNYEYHSSHIIPSDRYPEHLMGKYNQYVGQPLSSEAENVFMPDQSNPNVELADVGGYEVEVNGLAYDYNHNPGSYNQNQETPSAYSDKEFPVIPTDVNKKLEREYGKMFDVEGRDKDILVADLSDEIRLKFEKIADFIFEEAKNYLLAEFTFLQKMNEIVQIINKKEQEIYLNFGNSLTQEEKIKILHLVLEKIK